MPRRSLALILLILASAAFAGFLGHSVPPGLRAVQTRPVGTSARGLISTSGRPTATRPTPATPRTSFSAPVVAVRAIDADGEITDLVLSQPTDLTDPLSVPPGTVDLELTLGGPLVLHGAKSTRSLDMPLLVVAVDDPDALQETGEVVLDLEVASALAAPSDAEAMALIQDGALALPW